MAVSTDTLPEKPAAAPAFRLRDMLFPEALLDRTNWRDNPLVTYSQRRARRPGLYVFTRLLELFLLLGWLLTINLRFSFGASLAEMFFPERVFDDLFYFLDSRALGPGGFVLVFLLLRYHLLINDQSNHIKTLSREKLAELLLTPLRGEDYFLHHFLLFCHKYRVLVAWAALWLVTLSRDILGGGTAWVQLSCLTAILTTLNIVLLTWVAGVFQYVLEWKSFAGGRAVRWRILLSLFISAFLALGISAVIGVPFVAGRGVWSVIPAILFLCAAPVSCFITFVYGRNTSEIALPWLVSRLRQEDFAYDWMYPLDPFFPNRWRGLFSHIAKLDRKRYAKVLADNALYIFLFPLCTLAIYEFSSMFSGRLSWFAQGVVVNLLVIAMGLSVPERIDRDNLRDFYLRAMTLVGVIGACLGALALWRFLKNPGPVSNQDQLVFTCVGILYSVFMSNISHCLMALTIGVLLANAYYHSRHKWTRVLIVILLPIVFQFIDMVPGVLFYFLRYPRTGATSIAFSVAFMVIHYTLIYQTVKLTWTFFLRRKKALFMIAERGE